MKIGKTKVVVIWFFILCGSIALFAQDAHYSQYDASTLVLNPAMTGTFGVPQKYRLAMQYRSQWGTLGGRIATSSLAYDMIYKKRWALGGYMLDYDAPDDFNVLNIVVSGAYKISLPGQDKQILTAGLQLGLINKNNKDLSFDNQYVNGNFDPDLPSGEDYRKNSILMPEVNMGVAYRQADKSLKANPYGGLAMFHVTSPKEKFFETSSGSRLPIRFVLNGGTEIAITEKISVDPHFLWMKQKTARDIIVGVRGAFDFKSGTSALSSSIAVMGGISYRYQDAIITELGLKYKNFIYKFSHDFTVSTLKEFNSRKGALELAVVYKGN